MSDSMSKAELSQSGGQPAEIGAPPQSAEERNAGGQAGMPFLGSGSAAGAEGVV